MLANGLSADPDEALNGRAILHARGRVPGGCSSINATIHMHGQARDYDTWAQLTGDQAWRRQNVLRGLRFFTPAEPETGQAKAKESERRGFGGQAPCRADPGCYR